jgi:hypothetical protein
MGGVPLSNILLLAVIVMLAYTAQSITGFGSTIIAVTLGAFWFPLPILIPALVILDIGVNAFLAARFHSDANYSILFKRILPFMALGAIPGLFLFHYLDGPYLKILFSCFVIILSIRELTLRDIRAVGLPPLVEKSFFLTAGMIHGMYASGGPLLVYGLGKQLGRKGAVRTTLALLWLIISLIMTGYYTCKSILEIQSIMLAGIMVVPVVLGTVTGLHLHNRMDDRAFRRLLFVFLGISGFVLLLKTLIG